MAKREVSKTNKAAAPNSKSKISNPKPSTSEIDTIFSSAKGKAKETGPDETTLLADVSATQPISSKPKKASKAKGVAVLESQHEKDSSSHILNPKKRPRSEPTVVLDPSASIEAKARASASKNALPSAKRRKGDEEDKDHEEDLKFIDSRGSGPRKQTEEGFLIYKEDELGITDRGGDTLLCPFDCDCCF